MCRLPVRHVAEATGRREPSGRSGQAFELESLTESDRFKDKAEAAYHRTDLLEQRRELLNAWTTFVAGDVVGQK